MLKSKLFRDSAENLSYLKRSLQIHIKELPEGELRIYQRKIGEKMYHNFAHVMPDGKIKYIKNNHALLEKLALKLFLEKELQHIELLIDACNTAAEENDCLTITSILNEIPEEIRSYIPFDTGKDSVKTKDKTQLERMRNWKNKKYPENDFYKNTRKHRTSDGTLVKSKSELIIYEKLLHYGITFKYESPISIGGKTFYPDFTIMLPDGRIMYWEHAGMMNQESYIARHKAKMEAYEIAGIVPWKNLIVTYDDENENLDIRIIESEIKNKLLV